MGPFLRRYGGHIRRNYPRLARHGYLAGLGAAAGYARKRPVVTRPKNPLATKNPTKVVYKKKLNQGVHENRAGSSSVFNYGYRPKPKIFYKLEKTLPNLYYIKNNNGIIASTSAGLQAVGLVGTCFQDYDMTYLYNNALTQQYGTATPTGYKTLKLFLKRCSSEIMFNNQADDQCKLILYDCIARRDSYDITSPVYAFQNGLADEVTTGTSTGAYLIPGANPFSSDMFTSFYNVKKITHVDLAPGQMHTHRVEWHPNRMIPGEVVYRSSISAMKNLTCFTMAVLIGAPIANISGGTTCAASKVLWFNKKQYDFTYIANDMTTVNQQSAATTNTSGVIMNEITGTTAPFLIVT